MFHTQPAQGMGKGKGKILQQHLMARAGASDAGEGGGRPKGKGSFQGELTLQDEHACMLFHTQPAQGMGKGKGQQQHLMARAAGASDAGGGGGGPKGKGIFQGELTFQDERDRRWHEIARELRVQLEELEADTARCEQIFEAKHNCPAPPAFCDVPDFRGMNAYKKVAALSDYITEQQEVVDQFLQQAAP